MSAIREALAPLVRVGGGSISRERDVLRVVARLDDPANVQAARIEVLKWATKRVGDLPKAAWDGERFEEFRAGRNCVGEVWSSDDAELWAVRVDDPDKEEPGRVWSTEVVIGGRRDDRPWCTLRLLVNSPEREVDAIPHAPGLLQQLTHDGWLRQRNRLVEPVWRIVDEKVAEDLCDLLTDAERQRPVIILSTDAEMGAVDPALDPDRLGNAVLGLAHVVVLPAEQAWALTERFGRRLSVFHGGVRAYMPGFDEGADPFEHRLFVANRIDTEDTRKACEVWLRRLSATESLRRRALGRDVPMFSQVRSAVLAARRERLGSAGAATSQLLEAVEEENKQLSSRIADNEAYLDQIAEEMEAERVRADSAETHLHGMRARLAQLEAALVSKGALDVVIEPAPVEWGDDFLQWVERNFAARILLLSSARKGAKKPLFENVELVARCIEWLAGPARDSLLGKNGLDLRDHTIESGIHNAPCGGDEFSTSGRTQEIDIKWHIKKGGNTRDPKRCLRIYWGWDDDAQEIVIADMPAHRVTGAT